MKILVMLIIMSQAHALEICTTTNNGFNQSTKLAISYTGKHALIETQLCHIMANGDQRCEFQEASYAIYDSQASRSGQILGLVKEDGAGVDEMTIVVSTVYNNCLPRQRCYRSWISNDKTYEGKNHHGSTLFKCTKKNRQLQSLHSAFKLRPLSDKNKQNKTWRN